MCRIWMKEKEDKQSKKCLLTVMKGRDKFKTKRRACTPPTTLDCEASFHAHILYIIRGEKTFAHHNRLRSFTNSIQYILLAYNNHIHSSFHIHLKKKKGINAILFAFFLLWLCPPSLHLYSSYDSQKKKLQLHSINLCPFLFIF